MEIGKESEKDDREASFYIVANDAGEYRIENLRYEKYWTVTPVFPDIESGEEVVAHIHTHPGDDRMVMSAGDIADPDIVQCLFLPRTGEIKCVQWKGTGRYPRELADEEQKLLEWLDRGVPKAEWNKFEEFERRVKAYLDKHYEVVCQDALW